MGRLGTAEEVADVIVFIASPRAHWINVLKGATSTLLIEVPLGSSPDGYCAFAVSGTDNRDDVRASLLTFGSQTIPGTTIPIHSRIVEGH